MTGAVAVDGRKTRFNQNLVADFEKSAAGWNFGTTAIQMQRISVADAYSGSWVARGVANGGIVDLLSDRVYVSPGDVLFFETWIRRVSATGDTSGGEVGLAITVERSDNSTVYPNILTNTSPNTMPTTWTRFFGLITMPPLATNVRARLTIRNSVTAGTFDFDAAIMRKVS